MVPVEIESRSLARANGIKNPDGSTVWGQQHTNATFEWRPFLTPERSSELAGLTVSSVHDIELLLEDKLK